ncbi:MAG: hypothetical protein KDK00_12600 [Rhodobacteraceae bacterium]|nr:hypothetical protein [Paracoccaceae bacterium]
MDKFRRGMLVALAALPLVQGAQAQGVGLSGAYVAYGLNPDGSAYQGDVTIIHAGQSVAMTWRIGNDTYRGEGTLEGRVLSVNWGDGQPVIYVVMPNGALHGTWADGTALEKLVPD